MILVSSSGQKEAGRADPAEGTFHKVKGTIKEVAGKVSLNDDLEDEGKDEKRAGKIWEKISDIEKVVGK